MAENRLEIILSAKTAGIEKSLASVDARVKQTAKGVGQGFTTATGEVQKFEDALESVEFQGIAAEAQTAAAGVTKAFAKTGDDLKAAFSNTGDSGLEPVFDGAKAAVSAFANEAASSMAKVESTFDRAKAALGDFIDQVNGADLGALADGARKVSDSIAGVTDRAAEAADGVREVDLQLRQTFANPADVVKYTAVVRDLQGQFENLSTDELVEGIKTLNKNGALSAENLQRLANISKATGKSLGELSEPFGKFFAEAGKGQDLEAFNQLAELVGVNAEALKNLGAVVKDGNILGDTPEQIKAANDAFLQFVDSNKQFTDVSRRSRDSISELNAETKKLSDGIGAGTLEFQRSVAEGILPYIKGLNSLTDKQKAAIGVAAQMAGGFAKTTATVIEFGAFALLAANQYRTFAATTVAASTAVAGGVAEVEAAFLLASGQATAATAAVSGLIAPLVAIAATAAGIILIANEFRKMRQAINEAEEAQQSLLDTQRLALAQDAKRAELSTKTVDAIRAEAEAIEDAGKRRALITDAIIGKEARAALERQRGSNELAGQLEAEARILRQNRDGYDQRAKVVADTEAARVESVKNANEESAKAYEADAAASKAAEEKKTADAAAEAEKRAKIREELAARELEIQGGDATIKRDSQVATIDAEIASLEEKIGAEGNVAALVREQLLQRAKVLKTYEDELAAIERITLARAKDAELANSKGDKEAQAQIEEQYAAKQRQADAKTAANKASIDKQAAAAAKTADDKQIKSKADAAKRQADMDKQGADLRRAQHDEEQKALEAQFAERRKILEDQAARGINVSGQLAQLAQEETAARQSGVEKTLALEEQRIAAELAAANIGASKAQQELNAQKAALDLAKARNQAADDSSKLGDSGLQTLKDQTAELVKQKQLLEDQTAEKKKQAGFDTTIAAGAQTVEEAFGEGNTSFGTSRKDREAKDEQGRTAEDIQREIDRNKAQIGNIEGAKKRREDEPPAGAASTTPTGPPPPVSTIPNTAEMGMLAEIRGLRADIKALASALANQGASMDIPRLGRGGQRPEGTV